VSNLTVKLTFDLGRWWLAGSPVGSNRSATQPLAIHRGDRTLGLLRNKLRAELSQRRDTCWSVGRIHGQKRKMIRHTHTHTHTHRTQKQSTGDRVGEWRGSLKSLPREQTTAVFNTPWIFFHAVACDLSAHLRAQKLQPLGRSGLVLDFTTEREGQKTQVQIAHAGDPFRSIYFFLFVNKAAALRFSYCSS
jgi:hypothetical protein